MHLHTSSDIEHGDVMRPFLAALALCLLAGGCPKEKKDTPAAPTKVKKPAKTEPHKAPKPEAPEPHATRPPPDRPKGLPALPKEGTVVFLGDSITWGNHFLDYIEAYIASRTPDSKVRIVNRGVMGDKATDALARLDRDVVPEKPKMVVVMLGMNDGGLEGYDPAKKEAYLKNMEKLVKALRERTKATLVLITTTDVLPKNERMKQYSRLLAEMAAGLRDLAGRLKVPLIDLFHHFSSALHRGLEASPKVQLMNDDIHPGPAGHLVMAELVIRHLVGSGPPPPITVEMKGKPEQRVQLPARAPTIFLPPPVRAAWSLLPEESRFNRWLLKVNGATGPVRLEVAGKTLGTFTKEQQTSGIDLNALEQAPWCRQAAGLQRILQERWRIDGRLREIAIETARAKREGRPPPKVEPPEVQQQQRKQLEELRREAVRQRGQVPPRGPELVIKSAG
jgi:lysophospholipase L1-like esterase